MPWAIPTTTAVAPQVRARDPAAESAPKCDDRDRHQPLGGQPAHRAPLDVQVRAEDQRHRAGEEPAVSHRRRRGRVADDVLGHHHVRDDAGDDREVAQRHQIASQDAAARAAGVAQRVLGDLGDVREVRPPQHARADHRDPGAQHRRAIEPELGGGGADRDQRLAERDDHEQRVALGEVAGVERPLAAGAAERGPDVERDRDRVGDRAGVAVEQAADQHRGRRQRRHRRVRHERAPALGVAHRLGPLHRQHQPLHRQVGRAEPRPAVAVRGRDGDRHQQRRRHGHQHQQPRAGVALQVERGAGPRVLRPQPPRQPGDQRAAADAGRGQVVGDQAGDLGDREHEHQIEEQLEVGGVALLLDGGVGGVSGVGGGLGGHRRRA